MLNSRAEEQTWDMLPGKLHHISTVRRLEIAVVGYAIG